jgi:hypothetical protein
MVGKGQNLGRIRLHLDDCFHHGGAQQFVVVVGDPHVHVGIDQWVLGAAAKHLDDRRLGSPTHVNTQDKNFPSLAGKNSIVYACGPHKKQLLPNISEKFDRTLRLRSKKSVESSPEISDKNEQQQSQEAKKRTFLRYHARGRAQIGVLCEGFNMFFESHGGRVKHLFR